MNHSPQIEKIDSDYMQISVVQSNEKETDILC